MEAKGLWLWGVSEFQWELGTWTAQTLLKAPSMPSAPESPQNLAGHLEEVFSSKPNKISSFSDICPFHAWEISDIFSILEAELPFCILAGDELDVVGV